MKKTFFLFIVFAFAGSLLYADNDGGQPSSFLKRRLGARPMGYGGAHAAVADDAYAAFYNPAGAVQIKELQLGSQLAFLPGGRKFHLLSTLQPTASRRVFYGIAWARMTLSDAIEKRIKNTPQPLALLSDTQDAFFLTLASHLPVPGASWGINIKYISHQLGDADGNGFGMDGGLFYKISPQINLGVSVQDIYTRLDWSSGLKEVSAVLTHVAGAYKIFENRLTLMAEAELSSRQALRGRGGLEWWALPRTLALRGGYDSNKWTAGLGLVLPLHPRWDGALDYALASDPSGSSQFTHRASMTLVYSLVPPKEMKIDKKDSSDVEKQEDVPENIDEGEK